MCYLAHLQTHRGTMTFQRAKRNTNSLQRISGCSETIIGALEFYDGALLFEMHYIVTDPFLHMSNALQGRGGGDAMTLGKSNRYCYT